MAPPLVVVRLSLYGVLEEIPAPFFDWSFAGR
jgi:hypothetical protein